MIDAYEIGIQLALQDGVSAGLQVIGKELAALDQAVTATAGRLQALTQTAQGTAQAVRAIPAVGTGPVAVAAVENTGVPAAVLGTPRRDPAQAAGASVVRERVVERTAPAAVVRQPAVSAAGSAAPLAATPMAAPVEPRINAPGAAASPAVLPQRDGMRVPAAPIATAPTVPVQRDAMRMATPMMAAPGPRQAAPVTERADARPVFVEAARAAPAGRVARVLERLAAPAVPATPGERMEPVAARPWEMATPGTLSGMPAEAPAGAPGFAMPPIMMPRAAPAAMMGAAAPVAPGSDLLAGAPATPPVAAADEARGGGDVMLDGRLVGHWLADRMGRDAGRPAAGTTSFDARQAPAWTPSGAL